MAYLRQILDQEKTHPQPSTDMGDSLTLPFASVYPQWETQTPQYQSPSPYSLAQLGFRTNEVIYSCITIRADARSSAPLKVYERQSDGTPKELGNHELNKLLRNVNQNIDETMFHAINSIHCDIAGAAIWEKETNNMGELIRLWPLRPDWCSFMRGPQKPLAYVRYMPYGLPPVDIPIERLLIVTTKENFDPLFPGLKFLSPTMVALRQIGVHNSMTDFQSDFWQNGAKFSAVISVQQTIDDTIAKDLQRRYMSSQGGVNRWKLPLVLGDGAEVKPATFNFRDMEFPELDARVENNICKVFRISPILIGAKLGLEASSYNNYEQANKAWHREWVSPRMKEIAGRLTQQMMPSYYDQTEVDDGKYYCAFDTKHVAGFMEDRNSLINRAKIMYEGRLAKLDEARDEMELPPIGGDDGESFYVSTIVRQAEKVTHSGEIQPENLPAVAGTAPEVPVSSPAQKREERTFHAYAKARLKSGRLEEIKNFQFGFVPLPRQAELIRMYYDMPSKAQITKDTIAEGLAFYRGEPDDK